MTELLPILAICVIMALTYIVCEVIKNKNNTKTFTHPVTIKSETPSSDFTPHKGRVTGKIIGVKGDEVILYEKFSPPMYELEQWIRDNWKKIKVTKLYDNMTHTYTVWKIESEVFSGEFHTNSHPTTYYPAVSCKDCGLSQEEVEYLYKVCKALNMDKSVRLKEAKQIRSRKQLARKLQKLGYGDGTYESK